MRQFTVKHLDELLFDHKPPCVSLYQPTHRHYPDNQQDPIRYRNLLKENTEFKKFKQILRALRSQSQDESNNILGDLLDDNLDDENKDEK